MNLSHLTQNWRSTAQSILTVAIAASGVLTSIGYTGGTAGTSSSVVLVVSSVAKIILGVIQTDPPAAPKP